MKALKKLIKKNGKQENMYKIRLSTLKPGEVFKIGEHDFIVLEQMKRKTAVISKDCMIKNVVFDENSTNYNKSNLKKVIEKDIQPIIESEVGSKNIVEHRVDLISVDMQEPYRKCKCKVRPITFDEARKYSYLLAKKKSEDYCWTCTPQSTVERGCNYRIAVVNSVVAPTVEFFNFSCFTKSDVRPFCILKSNIFVLKEKQMMELNDCA